MQYATKSYRWVNAEGQPASPPPERMASTDTDSLRANSKVRLDPDERKVRSSINYCPVFTIICALYRSASWYLRERNWAYLSEVGLNMGWEYTYQG